MPAIALCSEGLEKRARRDQAIRDKVIDLGSQGAAAGSASEAGLPWPSSAARRRAVAIA